MSLAPIYQGIILDFFVVSNPATLLEVLIVFRQSHRRLIVERQSVEHIAVDWRDNAIADFSFDLRDPEFITFISSDFATHGPASSATTNLPLALRLFQHALKEGYIEVLEAPSIKDPALKELARSLNPSRGGYGIDYPEHGGANAPLTVGPDSPHTVAANVDLALAGGYQVAFADPRFYKRENDPLLQSGMFAEMATGVLRDLLSRWSARSFEELQAIVDHPTLLPQLVEGVSAIIEERQYHQDLKMFLPRVAADALTGGIAGYIEMLYRILKKQLERPKEDGH